MWEFLYLGFCKWEARIQRRIQPEGSGPCYPGWSLWALLAIGPRKLLNLLMAEAPRLQLECSGGRAEV